jgi:hypothetical protein
MKSAFGIEHNEVSKGWGSESAVRAGSKAVQSATKARLKAPKTPRSRASNDYYLRATRKFRNLTERSHRNDETGKHPISPMRSRTFAPLERQYPAYGGRTGSNWEFNGNKRVRKAL